MSEITPNKRRTSFTGSDGVALKEYLENQCMANRETIESEIRAFERVVNTELAAREKAVTLAFDALKAKLEGMNEIRSQLDRQAATLVTKEKLDGSVAMLQGEIKLLRDRIERYAEKAEVDAMKTDVQKLRERDAELRGKASQTGLLISYVIGGIGILTGVLGLIKAFGG